MIQSKKILLAALLVALTAGQTTRAVDTVTQVVSGANATGGKSIGAFGYDPTTDSMYVTAFGFSGSGINAAIRKVENVSNPATQVSIPYVSESQMRLYFVEGNPDRAATGPTQSGLLLNPVAIGSAPAYSFAMLTDASLTRFPASTSTDPNATKRVYQYDLNPLMAFDSESGEYLPTGDPLSEFTTHVTLSEMNAAAGASAGNTSSNSGRQFTWSGDGSRSTTTTRRPTWAASEIRSRQQQPVATDGQQQLHEHRTRGRTQLGHRRGHHLLRRRRRCVRRVGWYRSR